MAHYSKFSENPMRSRADFQTLVRDLIAPVIGYIERQGARVDFNEGAAAYPMASSSLEGVARPLWGLIPLTVGSGDDRGWWSLMRRVISEGTDPDHPDYWGPTGSHSQHSVEMAAFGVLLMTVPETAWVPFSEREKDNLLRWLEDIQHVTLVDNNWLFFAVLVQEGLRKIGRADLIDEELQAQYIQRINDWYLGDGWYGDGPTLPVDHYGAFAIHFYALLYVHFAKDPKPALVKAFRERASAFLVPFSYWFAETGEGLMVGRSLTYRFAMAAFWGMAAVCELEGMRPGQIKGIWARQIRSWRDKPFFTADGLMTRGYYYPNFIMCEDYNSPTSPYWAMKAFMPLALSEDSAFWQAEEEPLPCLEKVYPMSANNTIVQRIEGHSVVHYGAPVRADVQPDKYNKFAYSTNFGMEINALQYAEEFRFGDNILAFSFDRGINWQMRRSNSFSRLEGRTLSLGWSTGAQEVETTIDVAEDNTFVRRHQFTLDRPAFVVESGFAVDQWYEEAEVLVPEAAAAETRLLMQDRDRDDIMKTEAVIAVSGTNGLSAIRSLDAYPKFAGLARRVHTNLSAPRTVVPFLLVRLPAGEHVLTHKFRVSSRRDTAVTGMLG